MRDEELSGWHRVIFFRIYMLFHLNPPPLVTQSDFHTADYVACMHGQERDLERSRTRTKNTLLLRCVFKPTALRNYFRNPLKRHGFHSVAYRGKSQY